MALSEKTNLKLEDISISEEYEKLVPPLPAKEYNQLKSSIRTNGLYLPIIINEKGTILDGHHRHRICNELQIQGKYKVKKFESKLLEKKFVILVNLDRRQLNDFQRAELAIPLLEIETELAKERKEKGTLAPFGAKGKATEKVSKHTGVSTRTLERVKKIIEKAPEELKEKARRGEKSINKTYQEIIKQEKKQKRQDSLKQIQVNLPESVQLFNKPFQELGIKNNSISLIFTDPPYTENCLYLYDDLAKQAARVLRDGGSLLCYSPHYALDRIITMMKKYGLKYQWPMAIIHSGPKASQHGPRVFVGYKPMLWFVKGKYEGEYMQDTVTSEFQGKELHKWAQSTVESDYYIEKLTIENEIVYDPFLGQGTFGISAVKKKRQFIGAEINSEHFQTAQKLLSISGDTKNE
ncbi:MAG: DNA methyltransferase [Nitrosopumilus sp.]|nr:DNA methyltransferase [Nitrosopumilus sp.]